MPDCLFEANRYECPKCGREVPDDRLVCDCGVEVTEGKPRRRVSKLKPSELPQLPFEGVITIR